MSVQVLLELKPLKCLVSPHTTSWLQSPVCAKHRRSGCTCELTHQTQTVSDTESVTQTVSDSDMVTQTVSDTESVTQTVSDSDMVTQTVSDSDMVTQTVSDTESVTQTVSDTESVTQTMSDTESVTQTVSDSDMVTPTLLKARLSVLLANYWYRKFLESAVLSLDSVRSVRIRERLNQVNN